MVWVLIGIVTLIIILFVIFKVLNKTKVTRSGLGEETSFKKFLDACCTRKR